MKVQTMKVQMQSLHAMISSVLTSICGCSHTDSIRLLSVGSLSLDFASNSYSSNKVSVGSLAKSPTRKTELPVCNDSFS